MSAKERVLDSILGVFMGTEPPEAIPIQRSAVALVQARGHRFLGDVPRPGPAWHLVSLSPRAVVLCSDRDTTFRGGVSLNVATESGDIGSRLGADGTSRDHETASGAPASRSPRRYRRAHPAPASGSCSDRQTPRRCRGRTCV